MPMSKNFLQYPVIDFLQLTDELLNFFSPAELEKLVENCFTSKTKNYDLLAKLTKKLCEGQLCPLFHAIELLEAEAVKVMLDNYSKEAINFLESNTYNHGVDKALSSLWLQTNSTSHVNMDLTEKKERIATIAKHLFHHKANITKSDLQNYAAVAPFMDFNDLVAARGVNASEMNLVLPQYYSLRHKPLFQGTPKSFEDVLLKHTYSPEKTQPQVRAIYTNLAKSSKIASDIVQYTTIQLLTGDDLQIIFQANFTGGYMPIQNIICIGEIGERFTAEAILAHELGHYVLYKLFPKSNGKPFDDSKINILKTQQDDNYGYHFNSDRQEQAKTFFTEAQSDFNKFLKYEQGAKQVFIKAGELLGLNSTDFAPYVFSKDFMLFFKDHSFIDLFMDNLEIRWGSKVDGDLPLSRKKLFLDAYFSNLQEEFEEDSFLHGSGDTCPNTLPNVTVGIKFEDITKFIREQYFPSLIEKFSLNEDKIWFLERIAEVLSRAKDIYDCPPSYAHEECNYMAYYQELIVRYAELEASGIDKKLLNDSFSSLVEVWEKDIAPRIEQSREELLKLLDFSYNV